MIKGTTKSGFEFEIEEASLDDMELIDALSDLEEDDGTAMTRVAKRLLGKEQKKKLYEHLRMDNGRVSIKAVSDAIGEIFEAIPEGKN